MAPHEVDFAGATCYVTATMDTLTLAVNRAGEHTVLSRLKPEAALTNVACNDWTRE